VAGEKNIAKTNHYGNDEANARLIAACPQMVEALREMLKYGLAEDWNKKHPNVMDEARVALAAAEEGK